MGVTITPVGMDAVATLIHGDPNAGAPTPVGWTRIYSFASANEGANDSDVVVDLPTMQEGDLILVFATSDSNAFPNTGKYVQDAGYEVIVRSTDNSMAHEIVYRVMSATPDKDVTIRTPNSLHVGFVIEIWRGVDTENVLDGTVASNLPTDATTFDAPANTTSEPNSLDFAVCFVDEHNPRSTFNFNPNGPPPTEPTGFSNLSIVDALNSDAHNGAGYVASRETPAGSHDAVTFTGPGPHVARWMAQYRFALRNKTA